MATFKIDRTRTEALAREDIDYIVRTLARLADDGQSALDLDDILDLRGSLEYVIQTYKER